MQAGHCTGCHKLTWKVEMDPKGGGELLLWPLPDSRYALIRHEGKDSLGQRSVSMLASGISYCATCVPVPTVVPGGIEVVEMEPAKERYANWYTPKHGEWLRAHARDYLKMDEQAMTALMGQWERDRA